MKRVNLFILILGSMVIAFLLASCGSSAGPASTAPVGASEVPRVTAEELKKRLDDGEDILVIDARIGSRQYDLQHVPGAIKNPRRFDDVAREQAIVAYCSSEGEVDSASLASRLYAEGFTNVSVLEGGLSAWTEADYPVEGSGAEDQ